jgi:hypothetical protein
MLQGLFGAYVVVVVVLIISLCQAADDDKWGGWRQ